MAGKQHPDFNYFDHDGFCEICLEHAADPYTGVCVYCEEKVDQKYDAICASFDEMGRYEDEEDD